MQFDERSPIYEQIVLWFCRSLVKGDIKPGQRIQSIRELAMEFKVNTNTVQRAYQEMERRELIFSKRGTGYFITEDTGMKNEVKEEMIKEAITRFLEEMKAMGLDMNLIREELDKYGNK